MNILRAFIPWLLSGCLCIAFALFGILAVNLSVQINEQVKAKDTVNMSEFLPLDPISQRLVATLSMVPNQVSEVQLVASMIENHEDARKFQKGLSSAVVVFELIVEGDISRFLAIFRADRLPDKIEPIRSLRTHFVSIALGYKPLLLHVGGHHLAYESLEAHPELKHHDGIRYDGETFERDPNGEPPHNLVMRKAPLLSVIEEMKIPERKLPLFEPGHGTSDLPTGQAGIRYENAKKIDVSFGNPIHNVKYTYKPLVGNYIRSTGGARKQATPKNILILETEIAGLGQPSYIPWTKTFGDGRALLFSKGKIIEGRWAREKGERFVITDDKGNNLPIARGQVWVMMLESLSRVSW